MIVCIFVFCLIFEYDLQQDTHLSESILFFLALGAWYLAYRGQDLKGTAVISNGATIFYLITCYSYHTDFIFVREKPIILGFIKYEHDFTENNKILDISSVKFNKKYSDDLNLIAEKSSYYRNTDKILLNLYELNPSDNFYADEDQRRYIRYLLPGCELEYTNKYCPINYYPRNPREKRLVDKLTEILRENNS